jgi:hypothetical protein
MRISYLRPLVSTLLVLLILAGSNLASAWGANGHRVIGALAQENLTAAARAAVNEILAGEDLATVSTWADEMRSTQDNPEFWSRYAANWHYVNITPGATYPSSAKSDRGDAYVALETFVAILRDEPVPEGPVREGLEFYYGDLAAHKAEVKAFALKFLVHILGDLQQPLHSGFAHDRGGNDARVTWFGESSNLHSVWDTQLVQQPDLSYTELARRLSDRIGRTPASGIRLLESAAPLAWIDEAQGMVERIYARHGDATELGYAYAAEFMPTVEAQLIKGGLRTAYVLNNLFGG